MRIAERFLVEQHYEADEHNPDPAGYWMVAWAFNVREDAENFAARIRDNGRSTRVADQEAA